ncbi:MAG: trehalose-6-phosphate synthase [Candidatus Nanopelagicales bacterium]|nr:trehalose-6-phosphate synthase [Candidatus Nanopelagicales bacterium]MDZ4248857.1 trehalose-6-phosphate synthase [Candidatus Nanopelagicales bacterium]
MTEHLDWQRAVGPGLDRDNGRALVVVANRLPLEYDEDTGWRKAPGGLVTAMESVLRDRVSTWIGWSGRFEDRRTQETPPPPEGAGDMALDELLLTPSEFSAYYEGFSNGAIWPLYHDVIATPAYHRKQFEAYRRVNEKFARRAAQVAPRGAVVWVHDYQLQLVPMMLRLLRPDLKIGFFLHIPFPPPELFSQLPWRRTILEGLLGADLIGFQTNEGALNFMRLVRKFLALKTGGDRVVVDELSGTRIVRVDDFPIGIRVQDYADLAADPDVIERARQIRIDLGEPELLLLGIDRLDYTKGIDVRIQAVTELLLDGDLDPEKTVFLQVATPSREGVEEYRRMRDGIESLVSRANGDIGKLGVTPIHYLHQQMPRDELVAMYVAADVMLVTPLRDGMNLVAKEYVACREGDDGALVLSEFTGAAQQMPEAWLVNPYDIAGLKTSIVDAACSPAEESGRRMSALRHSVFEYDVARWAAEFLRRLEGDR